MVFKDFIPKSNSRCAATPCIIYPKKQKNVGQRGGNKLKIFVLLFLLLTVVWSSFVLSSMHQKSAYSSQKLQSLMILFGGWEPRSDLQTVSSFPEMKGNFLLKRRRKFLGLVSGDSAGTAGSASGNTNGNAEWGELDVIGNGVHVDKSQIDLLSKHSDASALRLAENGETNQKLAIKEVQETRTLDLSQAELEPLSNSVEIRMNISSKMANETEVAALPGKVVLPPEKSDYSYESNPLVRQKMINSVELHQALANMEPGRPVMGTIANSGFDDLLLNWIKHVNRSGIASNVLVASLDADVHKSMIGLGVQSILMNSRVRREDFRRDAEAFKHMGSLKTAFILSILEMGWDVLMSDADVAWLRDPLDVMKSNGPMGNSDILVSTDSVSHLNDVESMKVNTMVEAVGSSAWYVRTSPRGGELYGNVYESDFNSGVLLLRATGPTISLCLAWHNVMRTRGKSQGWKNLWGDQHALNLLLQKGMLPIKIVEPEGQWSRHNRIFWAFDGQLKLGVLAPSEFCNGHLYFVQQIPQRLNIKPYAVHNTFQFHYSAGKVARFREKNLWLLDSDEFYSTGNFLTFDVDLPVWITNLPAGFMRHKAAMEHYFVALQNAYAVADILDRYLIIPKVTCFCDRFWDALPAPCRAPGADVDPPFLCPLDHVLDLSGWLAVANKMRYRDSNFLESPRLHPDIRNSRLVVGVQDVLSPSESEVYLPRKATNVEVWMTLGYFSTTRILHLSNTLDSFCRYETEHENQFYDWKTWNHFYLEWCCEPNRGPHNVTVPELATRTYESCGRQPPPERIPTPT